MQTKSCKHTKREIRGYITVEIRKFNPESSTSLCTPSDKEYCVKCQEEAVETIRNRMARTYYEGLRTFTSKIPTPVNYLELQSSLAMVLPKSMGIAVVHYKNGTQIFPGKDFSIHDGDTIIVREIRPLREADKLDSTLDWEIMTYEKALSIDL